MEGADHETPGESLTEAQVALTQLGSSEVQESANSNALPVADTDALGDNSTDIPHSLLRTCDWSRTWPSEACRLHEGLYKGLGESSKKQALTQNLSAV